MADFPIGTVSVLLLKKVPILQTYWIWVPISIESIGDPTKSARENVGAGDGQVRGTQEPGDTESGWSFETMEPESEHTMEKEDEDEFPTIGLNVYPDAHW